MVCEQMSDKASGLALEQGTSTWEREGRRVRGCSQDSRYSTVQQRVAVMPFPGSPEPGGDLHPHLPLHTRGSASLSSLDAE